MRIPRFSIIPLSLFVISISMTIQGQSLDATQKTSKKGINYLVTLPNNYSKNGDAVPMLLFLHGGDGSNTKHHPKKYATQAGLEFPFLVIAPHCNSGCSWSSVDYDALLSEVLQDYNVDKTRIYVTGYSMGGYGTWSAITKASDWFAAAAPIAGGGNPSTICRAKGVAIHAYHGDKDNVIPYSNSVKLVEALNNCNAEAKLTTIKGGNHGIWPKLFQTQSFYDWLLTHSK